jgi:hypothetical protein
VPTILRLGRLEPLQLEPLQRATCLFATFGDTRGFKEQQCGSTTGATVASRTGRSVMHWALVLICCLAFNQISSQMEPGADVRPGPDSSSRRCSPAFIVARSSDY